MIKSCLFCGSKDELRDCYCGSPGHMNFNDIDYDFFVECQCGRHARVSGWTPEENHDQCVKLWNERGWDMPQEALNMGCEVRMTGPIPGVAEAQFRPLPKPPPLTLEQRLAAYKRQKANRS